jgi:hypothetical protein
MNTALLIKETPSWEVEKFKKPHNKGHLRKTHVAFSGSPRKHPHDPYRVILVVDPCSTNTYYYEFELEDITYVEELPNMVNLDDEVIPIIRVWVRKQSIAIRCTPFLVEDVLH